MSPNEHAIVYDCEQEQEKRLQYLCEYIENRVVGERLPKVAVIEEFIEPQKRSGDIDADYTVCGFVLDGKLFPTSINLCGTENGVYIEQVRLGSNRYMFSDERSSLLVDCMLTE